MTPQERIERATRASVELRAHGDAVEELKTDLMRDWTATEPGQTAEREAIYHQVKGLEAIEAKLRSAIGDTSVLDARRRTRDILNPEQSKAV